ncbi:MAG: biotin--[acetyl-CoA-carboxylase] ligase [Burkholderiales bacterium]|nr:biotin--[acetyl-CoA-carboxylase] ligase [Burkholderiales bacterium]
MGAEPAQHLNWGAEALWQALLPLLPGLSVEVLARADSTNTRLIERARASAGAPEAPVTRPGELDARAARGGVEVTPHGRRHVDVQPCLLVAEHQTQGRGRQGRDWVASAGASLTFSLALPLAPADWSGLSLAVGLALAEALDPLPGGAATPPRIGPSSSAPDALPRIGPSSSTPDALPRIGLKWPNDLWRLDAPGRGRKLGGILIETVSVGQRRMCVVGVGLNVLPQPVSGLANGYACLQEIDPDVTAPAALARVAEPLVRALQRFEREGFAPLVAAYARRDLLLGQAVSTTLPALPDGVAEGVDERGALRLRRDGLHQLVSGEVSVRLQPGPGPA